MTWCIEFCPKNQSVFLSKLRWSPKKKGHLFISIVLFISYFSVGFQKREKEGKGGLGGRAEHAQNISNCPQNIKLSKILTQNCSSNVKSPKNLTYNCLKNMNLPEILTRDRHLKTKRGCQCSPALPPASYATAGNEKWAFYRGPKEPRSNILIFWPTLRRSVKLEKFFHDKNFA